MRGTGIAAFPKVRAAGIAAFVTASAAQPGQAQETLDPLFLPWLPPVSAPAPETAPPIDLEERFRAFQRELAADFGVEIREGAPAVGEPRPRKRREDPAERIARRLAERFEGSRLFRWYEGAVGLYERLERVHQRIEASTRWNTNGFAIDTDFESVVDGSVKLHVEQRVHGFKVGFDVHDATQGRVGLRVGGVLKGYQINVDLADMSAGRLRLGLKKRLD